MQRNLKAIALIAVFFAGIAGPVEPTRAADAVPQSREQIRLSFAPLVKETSPAVVNIYTRQVVKERSANPLFADPFFQRFFGGAMGGMGDTRERVKNALGSGVIVSPDGVIVTNNHVIEGADEIRVVLTDRREFPAKIVGVDKRTDLAVLRISSPKPLPTLQFGDSDTLEVGDLVLAIGNPFGVGQTVTSGIVSGIARTQTGVSDIGSFIQTDAAINPGNSGGALIGMDGKLDGINTAIYSKTGGSLGIGFATPSNLVRVVLKNILSGGKVVRPWLGAFGQPVTSDIADAMSLDRPAGVLIDHVWPHSAAERAGLRQGDVIMSVDGKEVNDPAELEFRIGLRSVGDDAVLEVERDNRMVPISVALTKAPEDPPRDETLIKARGPLAGAVVANVSPALADEERLSSLKPGVAVIKLANGSPALRLGLRHDDRIVAINGQKIDSVQTLLGVLNGSSGPWNMVFERNGQQINLRVN